MRFGHRQFRPGPWPSLATAVLLPALLALGHWQLQRAEQKRDLQAAFEQAGSGPAETLRRVSEGVVAARYRRVAVAGRYDPKHQLLLDNRTYRGRAGYHVLTPFRPASGGRLLLVDRGWIPLGASREELPALPLDANPRRLRGLLSPPPAPGLLLGPPANPADRAWPQRIQRVNMDHLSRRLQAPLQAQLLLLDPALPDGFVRQWRPPGMGPERHLGYAVQWFALAALLVLLYLGLNLRQVTPGARQDRAPAGDAPRPATEPGDFRGQLDRPDLKHRKRVRRANGNT